MITRLGEYQIDDSRQRIDFPRVQQWLATTYWSPGVTLDMVIRAAENSALLVGAYHDALQVGYLRLVSDKTTFGWVADVYVDEQHRRKGIAVAMVRFAIDHPEFQTLRKWMLGTRDAHPVYAKAGFGQLDKPQNTMLLRGPRVRS